MHKEEIVCTVTAIVVTEVVIMYYSSLTKFFNKDASNIKIGILKN